ncbi:DUF4145 domain-containing protein [Clostridium thermobutyricum]|uniref:DUF4145 domain-containing protein n=1 Tax=Clostridium thermobutyricum TaxID=29372 RepID=UPI0018AA5269|nr:DUF4145 domain-containing protein [Clostridium thermobutyricum]
MKYVEPKYKEKAFTCPYCESFAQQSWSIRSISNNKDKSILNYEIENTDTVATSTCQYCGRYHIWHNDKMIVPTNSPIPMPIEDMPEVVKNLYLEARDVYPISYKAACALLRLALQHLCEELLKDKSKGEINKDIGQLVKETVPQEFQQALDIVRVIGNNAVHPGKMDEQDVKEYAVTLFELLNYIVQEKIVRPKLIGGIYDKLPSGVLKSIDKRDNKNLAPQK